MPEVSIFAAYSAGDVITTRLDVPEKTTANKVKALAGHDATAYLFARLARHDYDKKCACWSCIRTPKGDWKRAGWMVAEPVFTDLPKKEGAA